MIAGEKDQNQLMLQLAKDIVTDCGAKVKGSPFPKPNDMQKEVIESALTKPFTLVQGPPGMDISIYNILE